jgi:hypothetical protein
MSTTHFFPTTEAAQIIWLTHYALQLPVNGPTSGIGNEEIINTQTDHLWHYVFILQQWHLASQIESKEATAHKQLMIFGSSSRFLIPSRRLTQSTACFYSRHSKRLFSQIGRI